MTRHPSIPSSHSLTKSKVQSNANSKPQSHKTIQTQLLSEGTHCFEYSKYMLSNDTVPFCVSGMIPIVTQAMAVH